MEAYSQFILPFMSVLRPIHVIFGMIWFGFGAVGVWVLHPAAAQFGKKGDSLLRGFYGYSRYGSIVGISAIVTSIVGLLIWPARVRGMDHPDFTGLGDIVFAIGALFGVLAWLHGGMATGKYVGQFSQLSKAYEETENPSEEQRTAYQEAKKKLLTHTNISAWITLIAVLGMAFARYLG